MQLRIRIGLTLQAGSSDTNHFLHQLVIGVLCGNVIQKAQPAGNEAVPTLVSKRYMVLPRSKIVIYSFQLRHHLISILLGGYGYTVPSQHGEVHLCRHRVDARITTHYFFEKSIAKPSIRCDLFRSPLRVERVFAHVFKSRIIPLNTLFTQKASGAGKKGGIQCFFARNRTLSYPGSLLHECICEINIFESLEEKRVDTRDIIQFPDGTLNGFYRNFPQLHQNIRAIR